MANGNNESRKLVYIPAPGIFQVTSPRARQECSEDDGGLYTPEGTTYAAPFERLLLIAPEVAQAAQDAGLEDCGFTTAYGDLIAVNVVGTCEQGQGEQVAVWDPETNTFSK